MQTDRALASRLMIDFAERIGVASDAATTRYLWTDAFAVLNALDLYYETGAARWHDLAVALIAQVHDVLGRQCPDDPGTGWLSRLSEEEGARHPTRGGLRIGKPLAERVPGEPHADRLEWERDGQYWHYLTKWMDVLSRAALLLGAPRYQVHAEELARAAFSASLRTDAAGRPVSLAWKMSVDLSRPQVAGINPHDALDGHVTCRWLGRTGAETGLAEAAAILRSLAENQDWLTAVPLGLGGRLLHAFRLALLPERYKQDEHLIATVLAGVDAGLSHFLRQDTLDLPPDHRLGFRELGLAIGLNSQPPIAYATEATPDPARGIGPHLDRLRARSGTGQRIIGFWSEPKNRRSSSWQAHRDINEVMLATALLDASTGTADLGWSSRASRAHEEPFRA